MNFSTTLANCKNNVGITDFISINICIFGFTYFCYGEPRVMTVMACSCIISYICLNIINFFGEQLLKLNFKIKRWHFIATALGVALSFTVLEAPSQALLFESLEEAMGDVVTASGDAVSEEIITGLFMFFRVVVILAFVGAAILGVTQALQGSEWRPIANMMGIGVGLVLAIEVVTNMIIGT
jgi:hypothetical protein